MSVRYKLTVTVTTPKNIGPLFVPENKLSSRLRYLKHLLWIKGNCELEDITIDIIPNSVGEVDGQAGVERGHS